MYDYQQARNEKVTWIPNPLPLGTDEHGITYQVVGLSHSVPLVTVESLIVLPLIEGNHKGAVLLGRLWKFNPWLNLTMNMETLTQLSADYGLLVGPPNHASNSYQ